jgi:hypothetical protein
LWFEAILGKKFTRSHLNQWHAPVIPATWEYTNRRIVVQADAYIRLIIAFWQLLMPKGLAEWLKQYSACLASIRP